MTNKKTTSGYCVYFICNNNDELY